ncbi:SH3 domain-containing protein [Ruegeria intermedia]|uniref:SH3 domain-containing protein n=1 Tax=Ruegeria intermedia TaxID=996115 RepID=A0A1M5BMZ6_9RHOB|nr:SH3 domain-containing protein [Ruegeria intermedia]SHF43881.1 SH3 domain-containing protein [Ruegeria intermedia]
MTRLIVITFAALGWVFYVASGGPDFEPRGMRAAATDPVAHTPTTVPLVAAARAGLVTKAARRPAKPDEPKPEPRPVAQTVDADALLAQVAAALQSDMSALEDQGQTFSLASLDANTALTLREAPEAPEPAETALPAPPPKDIRRVAGTRVNMRDGPGTIYPIIGKARMGQKVEVLSDSGTGWLRLRVLPEQQVGWISASLIRKSEN